MDVDGSGGLDVEELMELMAGLGLSLASVYASTVALAATRMPFTGRRASFCIAGASVGQVTLPYLIGELFKIYGPEVFPRVCLGLVACLFVNYIVLICHPTYEAHQKENAVELQASDEERDERQGLMSQSSASLVKQ